MNVNTSKLRQVDKQRIQAQADLLNRITRGGTIDPELAVKERLALADRLDGKRIAFIKWAKNRKMSQANIDTELHKLDEALVELRRDPSKPTALGLAQMLRGMGI